jgi:hypothetical protein
MSEFTMPATDANSSGLSELELKMLEFERTWWRHAGAKESSIKELFNLTPPAYYQMLNNLIDRPEALMAEPLLVKRLLRVRQQRSAARSSSRLGFTL